MVVAIYHSLAIGIGLVEKIPQPNQNSTGPVSGDGRGGVVVPRA